MPQVSVIVPVYKVEQTLSRCVDSILDQTFQDFELILIDDGSPDNCGSICDVYATQDNRVKVIHKENGGVSTARNFGISVSRGDFLCFIDSDDDVDSSFLSSMIRLYEKDVDLVVCGYNWVKDDNIINYIKFSENKYDFLCRDDIFELKEKIMISAPWCKLFKADIIKKNNILFDETLSLGEDIVFNFSYLNFANDITIVNECLYNYRVDNEASLLRKYRKDLLDNTIKMNSALYDIIITWDLSERNLQMFYDSVYWGLDDVLVNTFSKNNKDNFFSKLKYNRSLLKSKEFKSAVKAYSGKVKLVNRIVYTLHCYSLRLLYEKVVRLTRGKK